MSQVFPSTDASLNSLKCPDIAEVAQQAFQSSKSKLGDLVASAHENTNGAELLRSKQGISKGFCVSFKVRHLPSWSSEKVLEALGFDFRHSEKDKRPAKRLSPELAGS